MPCGLRVNCTDEASASHSRWREIVACRRRPKKTPTEPISHTARPIAAIPRPIATPELSSLLRRGRVVRSTSQPTRATMRPSTAMQMMPKIVAIRRMLSRMSPLRMCENSWPTTACSSSRLKCSSAPAVTVTDASDGE